MSQWVNRCVRAFMRRFMPGLAAALEEENQFDRMEGPEGSLTDPALYLQVEDNGAETTIVAFAGMAVLYAAMPRFEFKKMLQDTGETYNFIFVRDVFRFYASFVKKHLRGEMQNRPVAAGGVVHCIRLGFQKRDQLL